MAGDASRSRIGTEIAGFRIESVLGRGGMSVVYLAEQVRLQRKVALKLLVHQLADIDESFRDRFLQESHLAAHLEHPNVIPIYDAGEADGNLYLAMRYIEGRDLGRTLERDGPLSLGRTLFILEQVASALDCAHEHGLVHRDVKPGNILLVGDSDRVYLTDFGVAKPTTSAGLTRTGVFIGTPDYSAPEQIEGAAVDARTDVYALGAVLYACLTATAPYARDTEVGVLQAHLLEPPPKLSEARRDLPRALDAVIATAMAKSKENRYASCGEMIEAARSASLDRQASVSTPVPVPVAPPVAPAAAAADEPPAAAPAPAPPPEAPAAPAPAPAPARRRVQPTTAVLAAAVVVLAGALGGVLLTRGGGSSGGIEAAGAAAAKTRTFTVALSSSAEVPKSLQNTSSGTATVTVTGNNVCWDFTLTGVDNPDAAHIHRGGPTESGPVVVPLGAAFKPKACVTAPNGAARQILAPPASYYVNVHTPTFPDGAVRGQLVAPAHAGTTTTTTRAATGLSALVPNDLYKGCTLQATPRPGAVQTADCSPPAGVKAFYPTQLQLSIFANEKALAQAYAAERRKADVGRGFGRCDGTSWSGEGAWFHAPEAPGQPGKRGGERFCYFDGNVAVMVWTHGKFGQATHVDFLGIAREGGSDHAGLYGWWRFWHHRIGKCLQVGCVAKP